MLIVHYYKGEKEIMTNTDNNRFANYPQQPHGGKLIDKVLTGKEREEELASYCYFYLFNKKSRTAFDGIILQSCSSS